MIRLLIACLAACLFVVPAAGAVDTRHFSEFSGNPVIDDADVIDPATEAELNKRLTAFWQENGRQMAIVTAPSLHGETIEAFSVAYARHLGVGSSELDDGLLLLVVPSERKMRIEVGYGLHPFFGAIRANRALEVAKPYFREQDFSSGITAITNEVLPQITPEAERRALEAKRRAEIQSQKTADFFWKIVDWILIGLAALLAAAFAWFLTKVPAILRKRRQAAWQAFLETVSDNPSFGMETLKSRPKQYGEFYSERDLRNVILRANPAFVLQIDATEEERAFALSLRPELIAQIKDPSEKEILKAVEYQPKLLTQLKNVPYGLVCTLLGRNGNILQYVTNPTDEQIDYAINETPHAVLHLANPTKEQKKQAIYLEPSLIRNFPGEGADIRMMALQEDPSAIQFLENRTPAEIAEALQSDPTTLHHVIRDGVSEAQILSAVKRDPSVIACVPNPTDDMQRIATKHNRHLSRSINNPNSETRRIIAQIEADERVARERELERQRAAKAERERQQRIADEQRRKREKEEEERRARRREEERYSSSSYGYGSSGYSSSSSSSSSSFSGGGGDFGGGGSSSDW